MRRFLVITFFVIPYYLYAQSYTIKGKVSFKETPITGALIVINSSNKTFRTISNEEGAFKLNNVFDMDDSIYISAYKEGYTSINARKVNTSLSSINIQFAELTDSLPEITITTDKNTIRKANKIIYKISSNNFKKKATADVALRGLPNISVINGDVRINNRKSVMLFIDGAEASIEEIKQLEIKDIDRFEVISNPSSSYSTEQQGGVINIIRKSEIAHYIKSDIELGKGARLGTLNIIPSISYKNKFLILNTFYSYITNNQNSHSKLERIYDELKTGQSTDKRVKGWQDYISGRANLILSKKSNLILTGNLARYKFNSKAHDSLDENSNQQDINYNTIEKLKKIKINGVYCHIINEKSKILMKGRLFDYHTKDIFKNIDSINIVASNIREYSSEANYEKKQLNILHFATDLSIGYKILNRRNTFDMDNFYFSQNIYSFYANISTEINDKLSIFSSFFHDYTSNKNYNLNNHYSNILPSLSILYKSNNNINLTFDYSKKITRPSANYLNPNPVILDPLHILKGNPNLLPQISDNIEFTFSKSINSSNFTVNIYNIIHKRLIDEIYTINNTDVISSYANIGNAHVSGVNTGFTAKILNLINLNLNVGVDYNSFSSNFASTIVNKNRGYSFNGSINAYTVFKKSLSINFNCSYHSRDYSLVQTEHAMPLLIMDIEKIFFKERLTMKLDYFDMFGLYSKLKREIRSSNFSQKITNTNRMTNLTLSVIFHFGKDFNDHFQNPIINNDDIHTK